MKSAIFIFIALSISIATQDSSLASECFAKLSGGYYLSVDIIQFLPTAPLFIETVGVNNSEGHFQKVRSEEDQFTGTIVEQDPKHARYTSEDQGVTVDIELAEFSTKQFHVKHGPGSRWAKLLGSFGSSDLEMTLDDCRE